MNKHYLHRWLLVYCEYMNMKICASAAKLLMIMTSISTTMMTCCAFYKPYDVQINVVSPLIWNLFDECRILRWIFIFVSFGPIHDWHIENGPVSKRYQLDPILSKISGYLIHFSWTRNNHTSTLRRQVMNLYVFIIQVP